MKRRIFSWFRQEVDFRNLNIIWTSQYSVSKQFFASDISFRNWSAHIKAMQIKAMQRFVAFYCIIKCRTLNRKLYESVISPILQDGAPEWGYAATSNMKTLQVIQNIIIRSTYDRNKYASNTWSHIKVASAKLYQHIRQHDNPNIAAPGHYDIHMHCW
jgi:hypothetical protein